MLEPIDIVPPLNAPVNVPEALLKLPAKLPLVAVIAPVIVALVAVKAPARVTLKGAEPNVLFPRCIPSAVLNETLVLPLPPIKDVEPNVKPPIVPDVDVSDPVNEPLVAVIAPVIVADVAVNAPLLATTKVPEPIFVLQ